MKRLLSSALLCIAAAAGLPAAGGTLQIAGSTTGDYAVRVTTMFEARFKQTVRQQEDFSCGSAALATLLTYHYHRPVGEREVLEAMYSRGDQEKIRREGFSLLDMKQYLEAIGYRADGYHAPLDKLAATNTPAIALIREGTYNHFVVVKGVRPRELVVGDPAQGTRVMLRSDFEQKWVNQILFVIHGAGVSGDFNARADWSIRPPSPLGEAISREGLGSLLLMRAGPNDF